MSNREDYCPTCAARVSVTRLGFCRWCDGYIADPIRRAYVDEDTLREAHAAHERGESIRSVSRRLHNATGYSTAHSFQLALMREFRRRGWHVATQREAARRHADLVRRALAAYGEAS